MLSLAKIRAAVPPRYKVAARKTFLHAAALANAGTGVECPCCGKQFRKFARFHGLDDQCPACSSLMRHRALLLYLRDVLAVPSRDLDVLDVAPSEAVQRWLRTLPTVRYLSVDLDSPLADVQADLTDLPLADESFDLVLCAHVLEHIADDRAAIQELYRITRRGGTAVIQVPPSARETTDEDPTVTSPEQRQRRFGQYDHVRICGADYVDRLREPGYEVAAVDYVQQLDSETVERYGLRAGEAFYVCGRPGV